MSGPQHTPQPHETEPTSAGRAWGRALASQGSTSSCPPSPRSGEGRPHLVSLEKAATAASKDPRLLRRRHRGPLAPAFSPASGSAAAPPLHALRALQPRPRLLRACALGCGRRRYGPPAHLRAGCPAFVSGQLGSWAPAGVGYLWYELGTAWGFRQSGHWFSV